MTRSGGILNPHDVDALTTVRRGFHTLKGSSRMVGLVDFSEAARHVEMTMNRWLQLEKDAGSEILSLIDHGITVFTAWVAQLDAGGALWYDAAALIEQSQTLLGSLDVPVGEDSPPIPRFGVAAAPVIAAAAETLASPATPVADTAAAELDFDLDAGNEENTPDVEATALAFDSFEVEDDAPAPAEPEYLSSLEATRLDPDALRAFEADEPLTASTPLMPELDLSATQLEGDLAAMEADDGFREIDLTATLMDGDPLLAGGLDFELGDEDEVPAAASAAESIAAPVANTVSEDDIELEEMSADLVTTSLDFDLHGENEEEEPGDLGEAPIFVEAPAEPEAVADGPALPTEAFAAVAPAAEGEVAPPAPPLEAPREEGLEVVSIEDELDTRDEDLPMLDLSMLGGVAPLAEAHAAEPAPEAAQESSAAEQEFIAPVDSEVSIGSVMLSRALYDLYLAEARQHIGSLSEERTRLQGSPLHVPQGPAIRAAHTLAGISGTARMEPVLDLARALEHALHRFEELSMAPDPAQSDLLCHTVDTLDHMVDAVAVRQEPAAEPQLVTQLEALWPHKPEPAAIYTPEPAEPETAASPEHEEGGSKLEDDLDEQLLPIFFEEADELNQEIGALLRQMRADPADQASAQALARVYHTLKGSARMAGAMRLGEFVHGLEASLEHASSHKQVNATVVDELEHGLDQIGSMIEQLRNPAAAVATGAQPVAELATSLEQAAAAPADREAGQTPAILLQQPEPLAVAEEDALQAVRSLVRVRADMVDRFVNEAGEISIARTRVEGEMRTLRRSLLDLTDNVIRLRNQLREVEISAESQMQSRIAAAEAQHANFDPLEFDRFTRLQEITRMMAESVGDVTTIQQNLLRNLDSADAALHAQGRLSRDLQQALMGVRMVPFEDIAERLYRVVRQTAKELGKRANLDIRGGRIEIDRGVLDKMVAPIEHLLRNAIAHGIEMPADRTAAGKAEIGQITLTLTQLSNEIALDMQDDGRGLNFERILARGRSVGLVGADETPSEGRLTQLIFEPGFSTAETVSGIAGRGVGMDVVKNETLSVGGRIDTSTTPGQGTRFLIHLPLTLAVTQALLVRSAERTYAIPSNMVEQALELKEGPLEAMRSQGYAEWKEHRYPLRYLPRLLGDHETQVTQGRFHWVLLLRAGNETLALQIDELRGNQEIIVKNAGPQFVRLHGFTGATVLPDGEISLILNPVVLASRGSAAEDELAAGAAAAAPVQEERVPTVMVVDDSLTVRKITSRLLEREGYQVVTAKDGVDALEQLVDMKPDVMLLDIEMPRMDGFDLARNIRADERLRSIPIIMITSRMADKHRNYAFEIGVNHYLGKPYQEEQLLELIGGFVRQQR